MSFLFTALSVNFYGSCQYDSDIITFQNPVSPYNTVFGHLARTPQDTLTGSTFALNDLTLSNYNINRSVVKYWATVSSTNFSQISTECEMTIPHLPKFALNVPNLTTFIKSVNAGFSFTASLPLSQEVPTGQIYQGETLNAASPGHAVLISSNNFSFTIINDIAIGTEICVIVKNPLYSDAYTLSDMSVNFTIYEGSLNMRIRVSGPLMTFNLVEKGNINPLPVPLPLYPIYIQHLTTRPSNPLSGTIYFDGNQALVYDSVFLWIPVHF